MERKSPYWGKTRRLLRASNRRTFRRVHRTPVYYRRYLKKGHEWGIKHHSRRYWRYHHPIGLTLTIISWILILIAILYLLV